MLLFEVRGLCDHLFFHELVTLVLCLADHLINFVYFGAKKLKEGVPIAIPEITVAILVSQDLKELLKLDLRLRMVLPKVLFQPIGEIQATFPLLLLLLNLG